MNIVQRLKTPPQAKRPKNALRIGDIPIGEDDFTPRRLALEIEAAFADPARLSARAAAAKAAGLADAASRLADLVMATIRQA